MAEQLSEYAERFCREAGLDVEIVKFSDGIESISKLGDPEQRIITVTVFSRVDMVFLQLENYCSPQPAYNGDLPGTSKEEDVGYHGFGLKSIRYTAEKYGGFMTVQNDDQIFLFRVTIPSGTWAQYRH